LVALQTDIGCEAAAGERVESLHERYAQAVRRYCLRRLRSREEADDATQVVFLTAYRCLLEGVEPRAEGAWLFKIAENVVLQRRRSLARRARVEYAVDVDRIADSIAAPEPEGASELDGLGEALAAMPETQRQAIVLREWRGLSYREVADELGISSSSAEALIFRARRGLVRRLEVRNRLAQNGRRFGLWLPAEPLKLLFGGGGLGAKAVLGAASIAVVATTAHPAVPRLALTAATMPVASAHPASPAPAHPRAHVRRPSHAPTTAATLPDSSRVATPGASATPPVPDGASPALDRHALDSGGSQVPVTVPGADPPATTGVGASAPVPDAGTGSGASFASDAAPATTSPASPSANPAGKVPPAVGRSPDATPPGHDQGSGYSDPPGRAGTAIGCPGHDSGNGKDSGYAYGRQEASTGPPASATTGPTPDGDSAADTSPDLAAAAPQAS
jgi:RNA polymerase sigma factor (sigma-70 family)